MAETGFWNWARVEVWGVGEEAQVHQLPPH